MLAGIIPTRAQAPGSLDLSFNPQFKLRDASSVTINAVATQADQKILIGGSWVFTDRRSVGGARLNPDGSFDAGFVGSGPDNTVYTITTQVDGKIVFGGGFDHVDGITRTDVGRVNVNGALDPAFNPGSGVRGGPVRAVASQADGKVIIAGTFTEINSIARQYLARLNADGSLDETFDPLLSGPVDAIAVQTDGKVLIGGSFTQIDGVSHNYLARLNADGSVDQSFQYTFLSPDSYGIGITAIGIQGDGKILIGGHFTQVNYVARNHIARLNGDGRVDPTFAPSGGTNAVVEAVAPQTGGKVLIGGLFTQVNGLSRNYIAQLNGDGSVDTAFNPGAGANDYVFTVAAQSGGKAVIGGSFTQVNGVTRYQIARLNANGSVDTTFDPGGYDGYRQVYTMAAQTDGKLVIGGYLVFDGGGVERGHVVRLNADGSLDPSFDSGATDVAYAVAIQADGKILIGGGFAAPRLAVARLNMDGSVDNTFNPGSGIGAPVLSTAIQPDGKILVAGQFGGINGIPRKGIARLNTDGKLDETFDTSDGPDQPAPSAPFVQALALQPDGKVVIIGRFTEVNGLARNDIARLNADGSLDTRFNTSVVVYNSANCLSLQVDGKIVIGGAFDDNGVSRDLIRLNPDGRVDTTFRAADTDGSVFATAVQTNGKIIIGGYFAHVGGVARNMIARLNADGSLDSGFNPGTGANGYIAAITLQKDGKILIGGIFNSMDGVMRPGVARLNGDPPNSGLLVNISTRLRVGSGNDALIGGMIIGGTGPKQVLIRALGPTLTQFGIGDALQNPTLELRNSAGSLIASNDDWAQASNAQSIPPNLRPPNSVESAILTALNPGSYTAVVRGVNDTTGTGLLEIYDTAPTAQANLMNISTRGLVQTGQGVMIAGLMVQSGGRNVIVRALGPSLSGFNIANPLTNPVLDLVDLNGTLIGSNDNWRSTQQAEISATGKAPPNDLEPAIVRTLPPGNYTAIIRGVNNTTGVALVEVYALN